MNMTTTGPYTLWLRQSGFTQWHFGVKCQTIRQALECQTYTRLKAPHMVCRITDDRNGNAFDWHGRSDAEVISLPELVLDRAMAALVAGQQGEKVS